MEPRPSSLKSGDDWLDLNLPVPDEPLPLFPDLPLDHVYELNEQFWERMVYDDAYFAQSLAGKCKEPFVM
jgi:hypothetical protein